MKRSTCYTLMASILLSSLLCVTSKPLSVFGAANQQVDPTTRIQDVPIDSTQKVRRILKVKGIEYKEASRGLTRLGSTPPRCAHKCGVCNPCDPIEIPANKDLLGVQYANYEPEGWKCKCGDSYFNP